MKLFSALRTENPERESRRNRLERTRWDGPLPLWRDTARRFYFAAPLTDVDADVVIVGAGFTGLWTALHLKEANPSLDIVVLEGSQPGFGASGRNGGWCSALLPISDEDIARRFGADSSRYMRAAMNDTVGEIGQRIAQFGVECGWAKGGSLTIAMNPAQVDRLKMSVSGSPELRWLEPEDLAHRIRVDGALGAAFTPHCAAVNPHALLDALIAHCVDLGVRIHGGTRVESIHSEHLVARSDAGLVYATARRIVVATEAFTVRLPHQRRRLAPVYSFIVATDPLPSSAWESIGWDGRETIAEAGHMVTYAQRTSDGRIVFGGRGAPYAFGSDIHSRRDSNARIHERLTRRIAELFPAAEGVRISHRWGGAVALSRDGMPGVWSDPATGAVHAGGYAGDGVAVSHLVGRIIAARVADSDDDILRLPINGHMPRRWAPEPARWLGVNTGLALTKWSDRREQRTGRPSQAIDRFRRIV